MMKNIVLKLIQSIRNIAGLLFMPIYSMNRHPDLAVAGNLTADFLFSIPALPNTNQRWKMGNAQQR